MGAVGGGRGSRPDHNFRPKRYHFLFLLPFDAEAFKTFKNTIKLINLCAPPLSGVLWYFDYNWGGGGGIGHFVVGTTQKYNFF